MEDYPDLDSVSRLSEGQRRLNLVALLILRDPEDSVAALALSAGLSRQRLYQLAEQAAAALEPRTPGPTAAGTEVAALRQQVERLEARCAALEAQEAELLRQADEWETRCARTRDQLELVCFDNNVSIRGTQEIIEVALGPEWRPGRGSVHRRLQQCGRTARDLVAQARTQVADQLQCVMADDTYFHRTSSPSPHPHPLRP